jgi:cysteine desulfurase family protein (TIGR01976 family)
MNIPEVRSHFPALELPYIFFDNPGGTQIAQESLDRIKRYLLMCNANHGGAFPTGKESDALIHEARVAACYFLRATRPEEIVFGANMTTLTFNLSRALGQTFKAGDKLVVTRMDHDANISPWLRVAEDRGCEVLWVDFDLETCTLDMNSLQAALAQKPKLVAVGYASNAVGTINPVAEIVKMAHEVGALVFIDAVQYAPHGPIDVKALECDFLVCSAYKYFGPHVGVLYGKYALLDELRAYKVRPAPPKPPEKFETGTLNHEGIAGVLGAIEYLEWVGRTFGEAKEGKASLRMQIESAMTCIREYEKSLSLALVETIGGIPGARIYGITDPDQADQRVPTVSFTLEGWTPRQVAEKLGQAGINVWDGNYYALAVTERLGLEDSGGMVRVGATHYNTLEEVSILGEALRALK